MESQQNKQRDIWLNQETNQLKGNLLSSLNYNTLKWNKCISHKTGWILSKVININQYIPLNCHINSKIV